MLRIPQSLLVLSLALTPGCFFSNRQVNPSLDVAAFTRLEPGRSNAKEVADILGAPTEVVQLGKRTAYRYDHTHTKESGLYLLVLFLHGTDVQSDRAWLFFDENDVLTHVGTTFDGDKAKYAIPPMSMKRQ